MPRAFFLHWDTIAQDVVGSLRSRAGGRTGRGLTTRSDGSAAR
jgi:hypothetical protein